jgi:hypothetical protein
MLSSFIAIFKYEGCSLTDVEAQLVIERRSASLEQSQCQVAKIGTGSWS